VNGDGVNRLHGRAGSTDWVLESRYDSYSYAYASHWAAPSLAMRYLLSVALTHEQANGLMSRQAERLSGAHVTTHHYDNLVLVKGIELTAAEAGQLRSGTSPLDILFPVWPELGYRLVAVPDPLVA
jgi:hypothetical protein